MESLWIENRRNAISIESDPAFFEALGLSSPLPLRMKKRPAAYSQSLLRQTNRQLSRTGLPGGPGNRNCFFTRFVVKRHGYGPKRIGAFYGHARKPERAGRDFSLARGVLRSPERPESESASRERRDAARVGAGESQRVDGWNN